MLEYDDQLPEEQAHPELLQELQGTYLSQKAEEQVLARVRERLLQRTAQPLSAQELVQREASSQNEQEQLHPTPFRRPTQRRWIQRTNTLVAALFAALLIGTLAFTFWQVKHFRDLTGTPASFGPIKTFVNLTEGLRLYMVNERVGWEMGDDAHDPYTTILHTTDGGKHWQQVNPTGFHALGSIYIIDENTVWLPVWNAKKSMYPTALYRTINGGKTWQYSDCPNSITCGLSVFADQNNGWSIYRPLITRSFKQLISPSNQPAQKIAKAKLYHTNDGGKTWQSIADLSISSGSPQLSFLNAQTGWLSDSILGPPSNNSPGKGLSAILEFYVTHDGGHTWKAQHLPVPPGETPNPSQISAALPTFFNEHEGYLIAQVGNHSYLYITEDGGSSWQVRGNALPDNVFPKKLLDLQHIVAGTAPQGPSTIQGLEDMAMLTLTNGKWVKTNLSQPGKSPVVDYSFTSKDVGVALINASSSTFGVYKTIDGGKTWQKISTLVKSS